MSRASRLEAEALSSLRQRLSRKWRRADADVLPMDVAEMDYAAAAPIVDALHRAVIRSDFGYAAPECGLGEALAGFSRRRWGWPVDPSQVVAVPDIGMGTVEVLRVLLKEGDAVVISPPVYSAFSSWPVEAGGRVLEVPLVREGDTWRLDLEGLERAFKGHPRAYLLCHPHNPVGKVHTEAELRALVDLAARYDVTVISDEVHAPLVFTKNTFVPFLAIAGAPEVGITVLSASKAFNVAGLKCAAIVTASESMRSIVRRIPPETPWRVGHLGVIASTAAFTHGDEWLALLLSELAEQRSLLDELLAAHLPAVRWTAPGASYLAWLDCTNLRLPQPPAQYFLKESRVALDPGEMYGASGEGFVRMNFATGPDVLEAAVVAMARGATVRRYVTPE